MITAITWKGYITPTPINDKNKVNKDVIDPGGLKAVDGATAGESR